MFASKKISENCFSVYCFQNNMSAEKYDSYGFISLFSCVNSLSFSVLIGNDTYKIMVGCPSRTHPSIQGVALYGAFFFNRNWPLLLRTLFWLRCHVATSGARLHSLTEAAKNTFLCKNISGRDKSRSIRCPVWSVSHHSMVQVGAPCTQQPALEPTIDQIRAAAEVLRC